MHLLKRVGDLLDAADEKTSEADLHTLTRESLEKASGVLEAAAAGTAVSVSDKVQTLDLDLGLASGWKDLREQITGDLKDLRLTGAAEDESSKAASVSDRTDGGQTPTSPAAAKTENVQGAAGAAAAVAQQLLLGLAPERDSAATQAAKRATALKERLQELLAAEAERISEHHKKLERLQEVEAAVTCEQLLITLERCEPEEACEKLETETLRIEARCEPLAVEMGFWEELTRAQLRCENTAELPEDLGRSMDQAVWVLDDEERATSEGNGSVVQEADSIVQRQLEVLRHSHRLEELLGQLMRESDEAMEQTDMERRRAGELEAALVVAEEAAAAALAEAEAARLKTEEQQSAKQDLESQFRDELQKAVQTARSPAGGGLGEAAKLRSESDSLQRAADGIRQETATLESRLGKHRAAAARDLERAVPSEDTGCWSAVDGPALKAVTLLVRSSCLRRSLATYLACTYAWLFFLLFWLEKH
mmetsp:Transcript_52065/g.96416  ORF Transcript_52065/g.96416 Transcript_52065/m.96416 type:complete len:479 (-) Transcript_52065:8-1444(-)